MTCQCACVGVSHVDVFTRCKDTKYFYLSFNIYEQKWQ